MKILKYVLSILFCNAYRLLKFTPNNNPIMSCMLPFAKQDTWWKAPLLITPIFDRAIISNPVLEDTTVINRLKLLVRT